MADNQTAPVEGVDNVAPLYNPTGKWQVWNINDIYLGQQGAGKYVPKVGDEVHELVGRQISTYIVQSIDPITYVPVLLTQDYSNITENFQDVDYLLGVGPQTQSDTYRVYVDKSVNPYKLLVDRRCRIGTAVYCKIFRGGDLSDDGVVVSGVFNEFGVLQSENIPMVLVESVNSTNIDWKVVGDGYTVFDLLDGETLVAVFYGSNGDKISKRQLLVENTGFVRSADAQKKYISDIYLESPFLSVINSNVINYPINVPMNSANLVGRVEYSDGSTVMIPINGQKFSLMGLEDYSATIVGQDSNLVLKYLLGNDEEALGVHSGTDKFITKTYKIVTVATNGQYAVQLFVYPQWVNAIVGYQLRWWMYDLDRQSSYEVTPNVVINPNVGLFSPTLYGTKQTLSVSLNLRSVNGSYNDFNHVQIVNITLNKMGTGRPNLDGIPNWTVTSVSNEGNVFGNNVYTTYQQLSTTEYQLRIGAGITNLPDWLNALYLKTSPMYDPNMESGPLDPTHFVIVVNGVEFTRPINDWNTQIVINQPIANNDTLIVKFIRRVSTGDLELAVAGTPLYLINNSGIYL